MMRSDQTTPKTSLGKPLQVASIVKDAQETAQILWSTFGIGPFSFEDWPPQDRPEWESFYNGRPAQWRITLAFADLGSVEFELIEHIEGSSSYTEFIDRRGWGLNHLLFEVDDLDATVAALAESGVGVKMGATGRRPGTKWILADTYDLLGWAPEIRTRLPEAAGPLPPLPEHSNLQSSETAPAVNLGQPVQIGMVVEDAHRTAERLWSLFGFGPFRFTEWPWDRPDMKGTYNGRPAHFRMLLGFADLGNIQLELVEPLEGDTIYSEFLSRAGEGIHHLLFDVPDIDRVVATLAERGIGVKMSGTGLRPGTKWLYLDTYELLGWNVELRTKL
jgi:catechol 2,3-dioxygenase-like lactoylglutathione lyase family enzyme